MNLICGNFTAFADTPLNSNHDADEIFVILSKALSYMFIFKMYASFK